MQQNIKQIFIGIGCFTLFIAFIVIISIGLSNLTQPATQQTANQSASTVQTELETVEKKQEPALSKEACYKIEKSLWIDKRLQFTDYIEDINGNYSTYSKYCSEYPAQAAAWKPDKYWFLYNNYYFLAKDYYDLKDYKNAALYYDKAIQEYKKSKTTQVNASLAYWEGGLSHYYLEDYQKAKEYLLNAPQNILPIIMALGDIYFMEQDFNNSLIYYQRCIAFINDDLEKRGGYNTEENAQYMEHTAMVCNTRANAINEIIQNY